MIVQEYIREDGSCPFRTWFDGLDPQSAAKVATATLRLEAGNSSNVKWIGGGLGEYRIDWGPGYLGIRPQSVGSIPPSNLCYRRDADAVRIILTRSEEHTSELQSLMRTS